MTNLWEMVAIYKSHPEYFNSEDLVDLNLQCLEYYKTHYKPPSKNTVELLYSKIFFNKNNPDEQKEIFENFDKKMFSDNKSFNELSSKLKSKKLITRPRTERTIDIWNADEGKVEKRKKKHSKVKSKRKVCKCRK